MDRNIDERQLCKENCRLLPDDVTAHHHTHTYRLVFPLRVNPQLYLVPGILLSVLCKVIIIMTPWETFMTSSSQLEQWNISKGWLSERDICFGKDQLQQEKQDRVRNLTSEQDV